MGFFLNAPADEEAQNVRIIDFIENQDKSLDQIRALVETDIKEIKLAWRHCRLGDRPGALVFALSLFLPASVMSGMFGVGVPKSLHFCPVHKEGFDAISKALEGDRSSFSKAKEATNMLSQFTTSEGYSLEGHSPFMPREYRKQEFVRNPSGIWMSLEYPFWLLGLLGVGIAAFAGAGLFAVWTNSKYMFVHSSCDSFERKLKEAKVILSILDSL